MTVHISIHHIEIAVAKTYPQNNLDCVEIHNFNGPSVPMFFPYGTGQAVADAINAAIKPKETE